MDVGVADTGCLDAHQHLARGGAGDGQVVDLQGASEDGDDGGAHGCSNGVRGMPVRAG
jgi:hypothetical protein